MVQNKKIIFAILAMVLLIAGCTSKKAVQSQEVEIEEIVNEAIYIAEFPAITPDTVALKYLSGNADLKLKVNGSDINIKGKLRIKRGEGVQISITPLGLIEAACVEFLPQKIRFINKLFKTYTEVPYSEAAAIGLSGINYNVLEAIFLNYAFLPDGRLAHKGLNEMKIEKQENHYLLNTKKETAMKYSFLIEKNSGSLVSCSGVSSSGESIKCDYSNFDEIGNVSFPNDICINFKGGATIKLDFELSKTNNKSFTFSTRSINNSYRKQSVGDFIKSIK